MQDFLRFQFRCELKNSDMADDACEIKRRLLIYERAENQTLLAICCTKWKTVKKSPENDP
ncbi:hypothetical protein BHT95_04720 [Bacillus paralicheniformis]|nr:hypothetical protein BHT95_04720 [Bacillus paralicheniformis]